MLQKQLQGPWTLPETLTKSNKLEFVNSERPTVCKTMVTSPSTSPPSKKPEHMGATCLRQHGRVFEQREKRNFFPWLLRHWNVGHL